MITDEVSSVRADVSTVDARVSSVNATVNAEVLAIKSDVHDIKMQISALRDLFCNLRPVKRIWQIYFLLINININNFLFLIKI